MRRFLSSLALFAACCATALPAQALQLPPLPTGFCTVDPGEPGARTAALFMHLAATTPVGLKALFADCGETTYLQTGRANVVVQYGAVLEQQGTLPAGVSRSAVISLLGSAIGMSGTYGTQPLSRTTQAATTGNVQYPESYKAILKQGEQYIIFGTEQRHTDSRQTYPTAAVTGLTVLGGKLVTVNFFAPLKTNSFNRLGGLAEAYLQALIAANP